MAPTATIILLVYLNPSNYTPRMRNLLSAKSVGILFWQSHYYWRVPLWPQHILSIPTDKTTVVLLIPNSQINNPAPQAAMTALRKPQAMKRRKTIIPTQKVRQVIQVPHP